MILIALVLLIAVGPEQLPGLLRRAGRTMAQLRTMSDGLRRDFMSSMDELERASDPRKWADGGLEEDQSPAVEIPKIAVPPPFSSSADLEVIKNAGDASADEADDGQSVDQTDTDDVGGPIDSDDPIGAESGPDVDDGPDAEDVGAADTAGDGGTDPEAASEPQSGEIDPNLTTDSAYNNLIDDPGFDSRRRRLDDGGQGVAS